MQKIKLRVALAAIIGLLAFVPLIAAVEYKAGVTSEDWVKYGQISVSWSGTGPPPQEIGDTKKMDWAKIEVQSISNTAVTIVTTVHYSNGTDKLETGSYDVKTGQSSGTGTRMFLTIFSANLEKGDHVNNQLDSPTINDTVTRAYCGSLRSVNVVDVESTQGSYTSHIVGYWDQATGVMLELFMRQPDYETDGAYVEYSLKTTETNMWSADILGMMTENLIYIVAVVVIVIVIVVGVLVIKRGKPSPAVPTTPTPVEKQPT